MGRIEALSVPGDASKSTDTSRLPSSLPSPPLNLDLAWLMVPEAGQPTRIGTMPADKPDVVYHERQRLQFCLLHALNNLFQEKDAFTRTTVNRIAEGLVLDDPNQEESWTPLSFIFKPHHNALTGNYDINVLIASLQSKGKGFTWHDRRNTASSIDLEASDGKLMGIMLNVPVTRYAGLWKGRHWVAIRKIGGVWYNLDSDLSEPYAFENVEDLREFLEHVVKDGAEVLLVVNDEVE